MIGSRYHINVIELSITQYSTLVKSMSNFPLYQSLSSEVNATKDLTIKEKENCVNILRNIDQEGAELVYALIRSSSMEQTLPFGGQRWKNELRFNFNDFPSKLKHLICRFLQLHCEKLEEQDRRQHKIDGVVETK